HRTEYSVETWGEEILAIARDAGLDGFTLIGHSLGGLITTHLAQLEASPVGAAIVVDSPVSAVGSTTPIEANGLVPSRRRVYDSPDRMIARFRPVPDQSMLPYVAAHIAALSVTEVDGGWSWKFDSTIMNGEVLRARFDSVHRPLAFLRSEFGVVDASARPIVEPSGALFIEMMDAGHAPMLDQPVALVTAFRAVFAAWDAGANRPVAVIETDGGGIIVS
ncbi:MAG: hypothetical protein JWR01_1610, partial [Subtercola sp.]|nr:hypothetical protein [Subtercola sp.]